MRGVKNPQVASSAAGQHAREEHVADHERDRKGQVLTLQLHLRMFEPGRASGFLFGRGFASLSHKRSWTMV